ncbi:MAG: metalloregulator ArsR/SmtB family transcription factor [Candidatus Peribacteraceae bacterium]|jgi:ArsR family transcriptional regulator|nr:metalloregulator ArsR/SmtB family transcription factor [Candidatus Peribacteraceae bacterium]MDP7454083.1 metalloregulator ArsR/SmtB family transcription factor [Candidatus Peribacteraceae bacterium]|tara:strand:- start:1137 stop:1406 length:270 start_codon:yes stop_codon:yes gene_type:complete
MTDYQNLEQRLKAVASARRLKILAFIKKRKSVAVYEIAREFRISKHAASQHLRILRSAGIVKYNKRWKYVFYRLSLPQKEPIQKVISML